MKKILAIMLASVLSLSLAACGGGTPAASSSAPAADPAASTPAEGTASALPGESPVSEDGKYELALITDLGTIDDKSFNQGSWEGLKKYAEEKGVSHKYYKPSEQSDDAYLSAIELAVKGGAKVIVTPGFLFQTPIFVAQDQYPDVKFILLDAFPQDADGNLKTGENTVGVVYAEEQPGFLAGYAAVKDGNTKLGFLGGMAVPAVVRYGYGFVQGAEYAAKEMGMAPGSIEINYHYTGGFAATPEAQTLAASWYQSGTQVIFACGGAVGNSAMAAAEASTGKVIGVDVDQYSESPTVMTSAMKMLGDSVYDLISQFYADQFPGGQNIVFSAKENMVGLPMANSKFEKFTQADYDAIYDKLAKDTDGVASSMVKDTDATGAQIEVTAIPVSMVKLTPVS